MINLASLCGQDRSVSHSIPIIARTRRYQIPSHYGIVYHITTTQHGAHDSRVHMERLSSIRKTQ